MHPLPNLHMVSMQQKTLTETNDLSYSPTDLLHLHPNIFCSFTVTPSFHIQLLESLNISVNAEKSTSTTSHLMEHLRILPSYIIVNYSTLLVSLIIYDAFKYI